jgi:hypothetical protein
MLVAIAGGIESGGPSRCPVISFSRQGGEEMKTGELLQLILRGHLIVVGEYRGGRAEAAGFTDRRTGDAIKCVYAIYLIECACRGIVDRAIIRQRRVGIENPDEVPFPYEKGKRYAFFLESFKIERGQFSGWIGDREPQLIEGIEEAGCAPQGALPPPNLVY